MPEEILHLLNLVTIHSETSLASENGDLSRMACRCEEAI